MNLSTKESRIRLISGFALLMLSGFVFTPPALWIVLIFWAFSIYLLITGTILSCPVYKLLGIRKNK